LNDSIIDHFVIGCVRTINAKIGDEVIPSEAVGVGKVVEKKLCFDPLLSTKLPLISVTN
jgi:hypothetical protein